MPVREVITRRNLPHWYVPGAMHFVTYRLVGTIPQQVLVSLRETRQRRLLASPPQEVSVREHRARVQKQFFGDYDRYLDRSSTIDWLTNPEVAAVIRGNLFHHAGSKYQLLAYTVMPNHVHILLQPVEVQPASRPLAATEGEEPGEREDAGSPLAGVMHSLKSYTAHKANKLLARTGQFWQHESYDHWVRDDDELARIVEYIIWNPVKAGLVREPHEWYFGSAHDRFLHDGSKHGYLCGRLTAS